jgi:hypothetical protein
VKKTASLNRAELDAHKTVYAVTGGGWIENYLGHGQQYDKHEDGDKRTVELLPVQAEYYLNAGQIEPIPGQTKGYPTDAQTGEPINLDAESRARVEAAPGIGQTGDSAANALGTGQPSAESALEVAEQLPASTVEEPASAETPDQAPEKQSKTRRAGQ